MKTSIKKTPKLLVEKYGIAEYQIIDEENIQVGSMSTEYLFSSGKYNKQENPIEALQELDKYVKKYSVVDDLLTNLIRCVDRLEENGMGDMSAVKRAKQVIKQATK